MNTNGYRNNRLTFSCLWSRLVWACHSGPCDTRHSGAWWRRGGSGAHDAAGQSPCFPQSATRCSYMCPTNTLCYINNNHVPCTVIAIIFRWYKFRTRAISKDSCCYKSVYLAYFFCTLDCITFYKGETVMVVLNLHNLSYTNITKTRPQRKFLILQYKVLSCR